MNEGIHLDLDTWIVPGQIRKANLCRGLGNRYTPAGTVLISAVAHIRYNTGIFIYLHCCFKKPCVICIIVSVYSKYDQGDACQQANCNCLTGCDKM